MRDVKPVLGDGAKRPTPLKDRDKVRPRAKWKERRSFYICSQTEHYMAYAKTINMIHVAVMLEPKPAPASRADALHVVSSIKVVECLQLPLKCLLN